MAKLKLNSRELYKILFCTRLQTKSMHFALQNAAFYDAKCGILGGEMLRFVKT